MKNVDKQFVIVHVLLTKHCVRVLLALFLSRRQFYVVNPVVLGCFSLVGIVSNTRQLTDVKSIEGPAMWGRRGTLVALLQLPCF